MRLEKFLNLAGDMLALFAELMFELSPWIVFAIFVYAMMYDK